MNNFNMSAEEYRIKTYNGPEHEWLEKVRKTNKLSDPKLKEFMPYAEVFQFRDNVYSIYDPCTHNRGDVWLHLINGESHAMVVDTGFGIGNLKALCDYLTGGKDIIAVNTHFHGDHSLGNSQFGSVYINEYDAPMLASQQYPEYFNEFNHVGEPVWKHYYDDRYILPFAKYEVIPCKDGQAFQLGPDHEVVLLHIPGHTPGGSVFLDKKERILFSGDAIMFLSNDLSGNIKPGMVNTQFSTVTAYRDGLQNLQQYMGSFDAIFPGHAMLDVSPQLVNDMLTCAEEIIKDPDTYEFDTIRNGHNAKWKVHGLGNILFNDNRIK